jgi:hypothetical protein
MYFISQKQRVSLRQQQQPILQKLLTSFLGFIKPLCIAILGIQLPFATLDVQPSFPFLATKC